jgi:hypothetical protein
MKFGNIGALVIYVSKLKCRGDWSMPGHRVKRDSEGKNRKYKLIRKIFSVTCKIMLSNRG